MINDYLVRLSTANEDKVANELVRCDINAFGKQNQASYLTSNPARLELLRRATILLPILDSFVTPLPPLLLAPNTGSSWSNAGMRRELIRT
jgi:hypothetical protein